MYSGLSNRVREIANEKFEINLASKFKQVHSSDDCINTSSSHDCRHNEKHYYFI
jgi:hypothetical protein